MAAATAAGIALYPLLPDGTPIGASITIANGAMPLLTTTPSGESLLVWKANYTGNGVYSHYAYATQLDASGKVGATVQLPATNPTIDSAVFVDDGFLVGLTSRVLVTYYEAGDLAHYERDTGTIVHVALDGTLGPLHSLGDDTPAPQLVWTGTEARASYTSSPDFFGAGPVGLARLDREGAILGLTPGKTPDANAARRSATLADIGGHTVAIQSVEKKSAGLAQIDYPATLEVADLTPDGDDLSPSYTLVEGSDTEASGGWFGVYHIARRGPDLVAAWIQGNPPQFAQNTFANTIAVARIHP